MGEWLSREYLARHLGTVRAKHLVPARCALFGYALDEMKVDDLLPQRVEIVADELRDLLLDEIGEDLRAGVVALGAEGRRSSTAACTTARWTITSPSPR